MATKLVDVDSSREKILRLLEYLLEFAKLRVATVRHLETYARDGAVFWFSEMPHQDDCFSPAWDADENAPTDVWLQVQRQTVPEPPALPKVLEAWIEPDSIGNPNADPSGPRSIAYLPTDDANNEDVEMEDAARAAVSAERIEDHPEVRSAWEAYLPRWNRWAIEVRPRWAVQDLYRQLFAVHQRQERLGELYELVVGFGALSWRTPEGHEVLRHVLTAQAQLEFDPARGVMTVHCPPPPDGARLQIEDDMIEADQRPARHHYDRVRGLLAAMDDDVWDRDGMGNVLQGWAHALSSDASFISTLEKSETLNTKPSVTWAPALILRRRTARGTVRMYESILAQIKQGGTIPLGFVQLVEHLDENSLIDSPPEDHVGGTSLAEPLLPLPTNEEQLAIVRRLETHRGVLVQGPPGTGKSHTIANLICSLLATGRRVLVVSETARALEVLQEKLPEEIQPLCVSYLGSDPKSAHALERSVSGIANRFASWDQPQHEARVRRLGESLQTGKKERARLRRMLLAVREAETTTHKCVGLYEGTLAHIAIRVAEDSPKHSWFEDRPPLDVDPPLSTGDLLTLHGLLVAIVPDQVAELELSRPASDALPSASDFAAVTEEESLASRSWGRLAGHEKSPAFRMLQRISAEKRKPLHELLVRYLWAQDDLLNRPEAWVVACVGEVISGRDSAWAVLRERTREGLELLKDVLSESDRCSAEWPPSLSSAQVYADARAALTHLKLGRRWSLLGIPAGPVRHCQYLRKRVMVNGTRCDSIEPLSLLVRVLEARRRLAELWLLWDPHSAPTTRTGEMQRAELVEQLECLDAAFALREVALSATSMAHSIGLAGSMPSLTSPELRTFADCFESVTAHDALRFSSNRIADLFRPLLLKAKNEKAHPAVTAAIRAVDARDVSSYSAALDDLRRLDDLSNQVARRNSLMSGLSRVAPKFASALRSTMEAPHWPDRLRTLETSWQWAQAELWLQLRIDRAGYKKAFRELESVEHRVSKDTAELASLQAWGACLGRMTVQQRQALQGWLQAIRLIGKGTGKKAEKYRREAREYQAQCVGVIPAWIMPRFRVVDVIAPEPEMFDVVIVDEASQTGVEGLFLFYLGKKQVIVGDDQQISPEGVGLPIDAVEALRARFLKGLPHEGIAYGPETSIYAHAKIRFSGRIVLREHFRCMPEIIQFSNDLCYMPQGTPLVPLRQYPPNRLKPVIAHLVEDGFREGGVHSPVNRPEAEAVVAQIVACARDPRYEGKSFGVISLLGEHQARLIESMLLEPLGETEFLRRRLRCGDSYAFQGDERDVMFLSLVAAQNTRNGVLAKPADFRRFNVAASRARDQMWLFHSLEPKDLSLSCVRRRLLEYCQRPHRAILDPSEAEFDSEFERHVYQRLVERGYRVLTQVPAGAADGHTYRIDLVVEGMRSRLAVECDGDMWHGVERFEYDMGRQRLLERAGWRFLRIRASTFYGDLTGSLDALWVELERQGIFPGGCEPTAGTPPEPADASASPSRETHVFGEEDDAEVSDDGALGGGLSANSEVGTELEIDVEPIVIQPRQSRRPAIIPEATPRKPQREVTSGARGDLPLPNPSSIQTLDVESLAQEMSMVQDDYWLAMSHWGKVTEKLTKWERKFAFQVGRRVGRGQKVTVMQAPYALRILQKAKREGFGGQGSLNLEPEA